MDNQDVKKLCLDLIHADREEQVVQILKERGFGDDRRYWRHYGDEEANWGRAGNQQQRADYALNEKLVNAVDSRLMLECMLAGISPESDEAPGSMREAVNRFIEKTWSGHLKVSGGRTEEWPPNYRTQVAKSISVFVTGPKGSKPCINIADIGEGQMPEAFPETLLSLGRKNKISVKFVQGKFGQGSTGAARFCGEEKLQLIVSRRHPELLGGKVVSSAYPVHDTDDYWGFTIIRREGEGNIRSPFLSYLAPLDALEPGQGRKGRILRFEAAEMDLFPQGHTAYRHTATYGTLVKLYEYKLKHDSHILRGGGLRSRIDLLLPEPALPMRFHECRGHFKKARSKRKP
ncbi:MAG: hypothetical protein V6Z86_06360 [Hyphomicrobiales bacterium]